MERVIVLDTTLRDGEQTPAASLTTEEKIEIARQLERLGVDIIEAGFPASSPGDFEAVRRVARECRNCTVTALAGANMQQIDAVWESIKEAADPLIHIVLGVSDVHIDGKFRSNRDDILQRGVDAVRYAKRYCHAVQYSTEDAGRADLDYLCATIEAVIDAGATIVNIPDTTGYCTPDEFGRIIAHVMNHVPNIHKALMSVHTHNDLGMATANTLAAIKAGARKIEVTVNGIGERAGNCSLEEVVMALRVRRDQFGCDTRINTREIMTTSRLVSSLSGVPVQPNKAIVGANAFAHSSGFHQDGVLKRRETYEIIDPREVGVEESKIILTARSGRAALRHRLKELEFNLSEERFQQVYRRFLEVADRKKEVTDADLMAIVADQFEQAAADTYQLKHVQVLCGRPSIPTASVGIVHRSGATVEEAAQGSGPVDAVYRAIDRCVRIPNKLTEYNVNAVTGGIDALGEVTVKIEVNGRTYIGHGADTDIIVASANAYLNALNRAALYNAQPQSTAATVAEAIAGLPVGGGA